MLRYQPTRGLLARLLIGTGVVVVMSAAVAAQGLDDLQDSVPNRRPRPPRKHVNAIAQVSERWAKEWSAKNLEGLMALYAEDAVFMPATGSRFTGRAEIRELFAGALASHPSKLQVTSVVTGQSGNLAYDSGEYEEIKPGAGVRSGSGSYLVVLRRDRRNRWRIVQHMWTDLTSVGQTSATRGVEK